MKECILVFPSSTLAAIKFANKNKVRYYLIGASSDCFLSNGDLFKSLEHLPFINDDKFIELFNKILEKNHIQKVYITNAGVWNYIKNDGGWGA